LLALFFAGCGKKPSFLDRYFETVIDEGRSGTDFWCQNAEVSSFFSPTKAEVLRTEAVHYNHLRQVGVLTRWRWVEGEEPNYKLRRGAPDNPVIMQGYVVRVNASNRGGQPIVGTYEIYVLEPSKYLESSPFGTTECLVAIVDPIEDPQSAFIRLKELGEIVEAPARPTPQAPPVVASAPRVGEEVFNSNCAACHQADGRGIPGAFPPLAEHAADLANASRSYLPLVVVSGLQGPASVKGTRYNGVMPTWGHLSDEEIAGVLNYITTAWVNGTRLTSGFKQYTEGDVRAARAMGLTSAEVMRHRP